MQYLTPLLYSAGVVSEINSYGILAWLPKRPEQDETTDRPSLGAVYLYILQAICILYGNQVWCLGRTYGNSAVPMVEVPSGDLAP